MKTVINEILISIEINYKVYRIIFDKYDKLHSNIYYMYIIGHIKELCRTNVRKDILVSDILSCFRISILYI